MKKGVVGIIMGSDSDLPAMKEAVEILERFGVPYELTVSSAHRSPQRTVDYAKKAERRGFKVLIVGAGGAAHLAGVVASHTVLPVIGVPMHTEALKGRDSLYSIVQMPKGIPVGTMAIGRAGAGNAALFAIQILALTDKILKGKIRKFREQMAKDVEKKARKLEKLGYKKYLATMEG